MRGVDDCRSMLYKALPLTLRKDVLTALNVVPNEPSQSNAFVQEVKVSGEVLLIPNRIYYKEPESSAVYILTTLQQLILRTLYTRHHDGYIRERSVRQVLADANEEQWITPYLMLLIGEYVEEIVQAIYHNRALVNPEFLRNFISENPTLYRTIQSRIISYWDCYYRGKYPDRKQYVGFQVMEYLK